MPWKLQGSTLAHCSLLTESGALWAIVNHKLQEDAKHLFACKPFATCTAPTSPPNLSPHSLAAKGQPFVPPHTAQAPCVVIKHWPRSSPKAGARKAFQEGNAGVVLPPDHSHHPSSAEEGLPSSRAAQEPPYLPDPVGEQC